MITLCIYYNVLHDGYSEYTAYGPKSQLPSLEYTAYGPIPQQPSPGDLVFVYGLVTKTYKGGYDVRTVNTFHVLSSNTPSIGDWITIIGVLGPNNQITNIKNVHVNKKSDYLFLLLRSFLALLFLIYIFYRYWYFNLRKFGFRRR